jgi:hypothetical protein
MSSPNSHPSSGAEHSARHNGGNCVEVADAARVILVRDTKDRGGHVLKVPADAWASFTASLK